MRQLPLALLGVYCLPLGCAAGAAPERASGAPLAAVLPQRVTATVKREASWLVRLSTEREELLATAEHPFAVPGSGWISAGRLAPGDRVVSERFGAVRLLSVRGEAAVRPVPVFNLNVASSHAYFVGTDRVLVHNTNCKKKPAETPEIAIERLTRERGEIQRQLEALKQAMPASPQIAELATQREKLRKKINGLRSVQRKKLGVQSPSSSQRSAQIHEADREAARMALEVAQKELADIESRPSPLAAPLAVLKAELEREVKAMRLSFERADRILNWMKELEELERLSPATEADRQSLERKKNAVRADLKRERKRAKDMKSFRKRTAGPEGRERSARYKREFMRRELRTPVYLADTERPRDRLELLEEELAAQRREAPSEGRDARISQLTRQLEAMNRRVELRRQTEKLRQRLSNAVRVRKRVLAEGGDTAELDQRVEQLAREHRASRIEYAQLRLRERFEGTAGGNESANADEARWREFEQQLAEGSASEQLLAAFERALDEAGPAPAELRERVLAEANDVDETLGERGELMQQRPSPERAFGLQSSYERLQQELREERAAVEAAVSALVNESAHTQTTQAGSSSGPGWQERLKALQEEQVQLRAQWRARLQVRLDNARWQLELLRQMTFRDDEIEHDVSREVALLERELRMAG